MKRERWQQRERDFARDGYLRYVGKVWYNSNISKQPEVECSPYEAEPWLNQKRSVHRIPWYS